MAAALLFWNTNMAAVRSRENALLSYRSCHWRAIGWPSGHFATTMLCWDTFVGGPGVCHSICKVVDSGSEIFATCEELKNRLFTSHYLKHYCYSWNVVRVCEIVQEILMSECSFGISSHWGACSSSSCCDLKHLLRPLNLFFFSPGHVKRTFAGFVVFNSLLLKGTYFCLIFWISKESRTENWDELQK